MNYAVSLHEGGRGFAIKAKSRVNPNVLWNPDFCGGCFECHSTSLFFFTFQVHPLSESNVGPVKPWLSQKPFVVPLMRICRKVGMLGTVLPINSTQQDDVCAMDCNARVQLIHICMPVEEWTAISESKVLFSGTKMNGP